MTDNDEYQLEYSQTTHLARIVLVTFLFIFMTTRVIVFLIMSEKIPDLYLHINGTHFHHLNYGIFLLAAVGAFLLFKRPEGNLLRIAAGIYGVGMALTFDEFGMWIHLGGSYWQRASWDAIVVLSTGFGLLAFAPSLKKFRPHHWVTAAILIIMLVVFTLLFIDSFKYAGAQLGPALQQIESTGPR
jgi:hypothetical protein